MDAIIVIVGIIYGLILIIASFMKSSVTEPFRIDALIFGTSSEQTRMLNLAAGIVFAGYGIFSLLTT